MRLPALSPGSNHAFAGCRRPAACVTTHGMQPRARLVGVLGCLALLATIALSIQAVTPSAASHGRPAASGPATPPPLADIGGARPEGSAPPTTSPLPERPPDPGLLTGYVWPIPNGRLTQPFGPSPWGSLVVGGKAFHDGIDVATFCGDRIVAAHGGVVLAAGHSFDSYIGWVGDLGPYFARLDTKHLWTTLPLVVVIDDGNGYRSIYAHFSSLVVKPGQKVRAGQRLGLEGRSGNATGCHLHYGLFSPLETATFEENAKTVKQILVPSDEIARIDPLRVLPFRADLEPQYRMLPAAQRRK
jgi:murein DD-endopeptidase MepM/ murein hydrolase activator NlpD